MSNLFPPRREYILEIAIVVGLILIVGLFFASHPITQYYSDNNVPIPDEPVITFIFALVAGLVFYSWWCGGRDHKENCDINHSAPTISVIRAVVK